MSILVCPNCGCDISSFKHCCENCDTHYSKAELEFLEAYHLEFKKLMEIFDITFANNCTKINALKQPELENIDFNDFINCNIVSIGDYAFAGENLKEVILPDTLLDIGDYAFYGCSKLKKVYIPYSCVYVGYHAFNSKNNFNLYCFPYSYISNNYNLCVGSYSAQFSDEYQLYNRILGKVIKNGLYIFISLIDFERIGIVIGVKDKEASSITIPNEVQFDGSQVPVQVISRFAFSYLKELEEVTLSENINCINQFAFYKCNKLRKINNLSSDIDTDYCMEYCCPNLER